MMLLFLACAPETESTPSPEPFPGDAVRYAVMDVDCTDPVDPALPDEDPIFFQRMDEVESNGVVEWVVYGGGMSMIPGEAREVSGGCQTPGTLRIRIVYAYLVTE